MSCVAFLLRKRELMKLLHKSSRVLILGLSFTFYGQVSASVVVVSGFTPIVLSSPANSTAVASINLNPGTEPTEDSDDDFIITLNPFDGSNSTVSLNSNGIGANTIALSSTAPTNPAMRFEAGDTVGPAATYGANGLSPTVALLAFEELNIGGWSGGNTGYLGVQFEIDGENHFGFARVIWTPGDPSPSSVAIIDQIGYETDPGVGALIPVPEPSTSLFSALAVLGMLRRRRR